MKDTVDAYVETEKPGVGKHEALATRATLRGLVAAFQDAERDVRAAFATLRAAEERINLAFLGGDAHSITRIEIKANDCHHNDDYDADRAVAIMARKAWARIAEHLELRRTMSIKRYEQFEQRLEKGQLPPITEENVYAFVREHAAGLQQNFQEAVREVFDWLRPRSAESPRCRYKTNRKSLLEIDRKIVIQWVVRYDCGRFIVDYEDGQKLVALENVFLLLDGQGTIKGYNSELENAIEDPANKGVGETPYFAFRCFRNRSVHLTFKRLDLLAKFNQLAGGATLRPAA